MQLHNKLLELRQKEKQITSEILDYLQRMEDGRHYLKLGYNSLFDYLLRGLDYSESLAYQRQACVRIAKEVPEIKEKIDTGKLSITAVTTAYKHIKSKPLEKKREILKTIENKSTREVKQIFKEPAKPITIKRTEYSDRVHLRLELSHEQNKKLEKLKALKSHNHDLESLLENLIDSELKKYENTKFKQTKSNNPRLITKTLRNHVLKKASYKCQHPGCDSGYFLQIDHIVPVRVGGKQGSDNLQVLCASHNQMKG